MSAPHDIAFGGAAVKQRMLTAEQVNLGTKAQKVLADAGIPKCLAVIAVEAEWMELGQALTLVTGLRKLGVEHPEVKPREASDADEAVLDRIPPPARKKLETVSRALAALFYARGAGTLALDQGYLTAAPVKRPTKPVIIERPAPPPRKSGALGAILAGAAAIAAIIALLVFNKGKPRPPVELDDTPVAAQPPSPPPRAPGPPPPPPPPKPVPETPSDTTRDEPTTDTAVEAKRKQYIEEQEREAAKRLEEVKQLMKEGRPASARGKLKQLLGEFGWTDFIKSRTDEIARLVKEADAEMSSPDPEMPIDPSDTVAEGEALPALAAAFKRLDDGAAADRRRAAGTKSRLAGWKTDLALRGGTVVKGAEVADVSREDLRVRGEIDGAKVDLVLTWSTLDAPSFLAVQKQIAKGQGAAGLFELGRAAVLRRLWKEARSAFEDCAKADAAWKPRLPDIAALLSDPATLRGAARRLGDGRLLVEYSFADADQASDLTPTGSAAGAVTAGGGALKISAKDLSLWSLRDLTFTGDVDVCFHLEGEAVLGFGPPADGQRSLLFFGPSGFRIDQPDAPVQSPVAPGSPVKIERRGTTLRISQGGRHLGSASVADGPRKLLIGARGDASIKELCVAGRASPAELARRLGAQERLEGGAHAGDFRLDIPPPDSESLSRAAIAETALEAGVLEEAWSLADEAAVKSPGAGLPIAIRALIRLAQGETRLAVADADLALALDPCSGDVALRARRVLAAARGSGASGAYRCGFAGPWKIRTDGPEERLAYFSGKLVEAAKAFAAALKEAGTEPRDIPVTIFATPAGLLAHLESAAHEPAIADLPGAEQDLLRQAAQAYIRKASPAAPAWFEAGMASHLVGDRRHEDMKDLLAQAAPLDALVRKPASDFTESDRVQSASLVRFLLGGAYKTLIPDLLKKLRHGVPAIEVFSGQDLKKMDAEWRAWVPVDK